MQKVTGTHPVLRGGLGGIVAAAVAIVSVAGQEAPGPLDDLPAGAKRVVLDLRYIVEDLDLRIDETPSEVRLTLTADILFDFDQATIKPAAHDSLRTVTEEIRARPGGAVTIEGHTDARGADAYNQQLSEQRAEAVKTWLVEEEGLDPTGLQTAGFGATRPVVANTRPDGGDDPLGRQRNRRVEIVLSSP